MGDPKSRSSAGQPTSTVGDGLDQSSVDIYKQPGNEYCRNVIEIRGIFP